MRRADSQALFRQHWLSLTTSEPCSDGCPNPLCYTANQMESVRLYWPRWAAALRRFCLVEVAAALLDAGAPLAFLSSQLMYAGRAFFRSDELDALAATLEDDAQARTFAAYLLKD